MEWAFNHNYQERQEERKTHDAQFSQDIQIETVGVHRGGDDIWVGDCAHHCLE